MRYYFKYIVYLYVLIGFSAVSAGSYDEYFAAIERDSAPLVVSLLNRGFDPNTRDPQGQHGLILALRAGALNVVNALLDDDATQVEVRTEKDESPLMLAALRGLSQICERLIARDADVNKPGWAPLHYAATGGHVEVMQLLLEHHAYIDAASPNGSTPLMMAAMYGGPSAVKLLLDAGADAQLKNNLGLTAIDFAKGAQRSDSMELIAKSIRSKRPKGAW